MDCRESILSNRVADYITDFPTEVIQNYDGINCVADIDQIYNILYVDREGSLNRNMNFFEYQNLPKLYGLMQTETFDPTSLIRSGVTQIQRPPLSLTGRGVVVCFIDTGIDYTQPAFLNEYGDSRILAIWDQTIQEGNPPEGFQYGTEYSTEEINRALQSDNPYEIVPSRDENGHGTAVAGVAVSSVINEAPFYTGAAPEADIVVVKLKECKQYLRELYLVPENVPAYQENDIMLGVQYANSYGRIFQRPVVICIGLGTNSGDHAGSSALSRYLNAVAVQRSRGVVVCGGNEGNEAHHYHARLQKVENSFDSTNTMEIRVGEASRGFWMEVWGNLPDLITATIRSPGGESFSLSRLVGGEIVTYRFVYEQSRITVRSVLVEPSSGAQLILFRFDTPTAGIWRVEISPIGDVYHGEFDAWLPITQFLNTEVTFLSPSPYTTMTEPSMAPDVIAVSTYDADNNSFYLNSGRGYSRTGYIRPDFAAPGVDVSTLRGKNTGSSLAAAITTGAIAQFLQWAVVEKNYQFAESREIKSFLIRGAYRNENLPYPNREWGYGRLDMVRVFDTLRGL